MTLEELGDLIRIMRAIGAGDDAAAKRHYQWFITQHVDPAEIEDAELNAICDERRDMPSVAVKLEDL